MRANRLVCFRFWFGCLLLCLCGLLAAPWAMANEEDEWSEEEARQTAIAERFLEVLEKSPRQGTALQRVYGHHVEFGTLDSFLQSLRERIENDAEDGAAWMLLGLFEAQRGADADAVDALRQAESLRDDDPLASYYLSQSLLRIGQSEEAVAALERALERKPPRADLLEIAQQLGRVHQRAQRTEAALQVWQQLETLFPDDPRVLEQIAVTLAEEGQSALALERYERLAELVRDDYRRVAFRIRAAELKIRIDRREEGLTDLETLLGDLNPDSWLHRDVRRRIEDVFLRSSDQDSLVKYYEGWLAKHPEDVDAMVRLARFLASSARVPEATEWMEKALRLAPSRTELRRAFIDQLVDDGRIPEALDQYRLLLESAPGHPDFLRDWGRLALRDASQDMEVRRREATRIWNQILATRPDDAATVVQVADLFRQSEMPEAALQLYSRAVELAPEDPRYREYLGEFHHLQERIEEALQTWEAIAAGPRRNVSNVTRLAEVYNSFGYLERAVAEIAEACRMDPRDFSLQVRGAEYHSRAEQFDAALEFVDAAEALAANSDERETVVNRRIEIFQISRRLDDEIEQLAAQVRDDPEAAGAQWHLLARYFEAARRWADAAEAIDEALQREPRSVAALTSAARIAESSGELGRAVEINRRLAEVDRRSRGDHLTSVARLEAELGRVDEALQAAQELIVSAPGNTDHYEFFARLCFRLGKPEQGLESLRKAVRINPNEPHLIMALGAALAEQLRTDEAIEVYWRAFEKAEDLDDKTSLTLKLAPLYQQLNQFDQLIERFERERREEAKRREMTICLAQAHDSAGDYGTAREELESLLGEDTRDTNLLQQLAKLCQSGGDLDAAIGYQRQLVSIAPGHETEFPLAGMLQAFGERDEAADILVKLTAREEDPVRLLRSVDSLLTQGSFEAALRIVEPLVVQRRDDWELIYREAVAWASLESVAAAENRLQRLLALNTPHEALGLAAEARFKQAEAQARSQNRQGITTQLPQRQSPLSMLSVASQVRSATGLTSDDYYYSGSRQPRPVWMPDSYGAARMAAYGWLLKFEEEAAHEGAARGEEVPDTTDSPSLAEQLTERAAADDAPRETLYDRLYVAQLDNQYDVVFDLARRLARSGGQEEQQFFLSSLRTRDVVVNQPRTRGQQEAVKPPLSEDDLELMLQCYAALEESSKGQAAPTYGTQIAYGTSGEVYINVGGSWVAISGASGRSGVFLGLVLEELKIAGRDPQYEELLHEALAKAEESQALAGMMNLVIDQQRLELLPETHERWTRAAREDLAKDLAAAAGAGRSAAARQPRILAVGSQPLIRWMGHLGKEEEHAQMLTLLDSALDLAVLEAQERRRQQADRSRSSSSPQARRNSTQMSLYFGTEMVRVSFDFPRASTHLDTTALTLLRQAFEVLQRNEVLSDLPDHLRERLDKAPPENLLYEQMMLGAVLWWMEDHDEALALMTEASSSLSDELQLRFELAAMHEARGDFEDALEIIEAIVPRDQQLLRQREMAALQLAERLGDVARARQSAERLFGLRLDTQTQLSLVDRMRRLGLHEMADAVVTRAERQAGNQTSALASLMMLYQGQGKSAQARQMAHMLLRRTTSPIAALAHSTRNPFRYRTPTDAARTQALQVLLQSGELKTLIEQLEEQVERSPDSPRLYEQLIEYYGVTNEREKAIELLEQVVERRPDSAAFRYQLAKQLEESRKTDQACDHYAELIRQKPEWIADDFYSFRRVFQQAGRMPQLVEVVHSINLKTFQQQPYYLVDFLSELSREEETSEMAIDLIERAFDAFPTYRSQMISRLRDDQLWKNDRVYEVAKRAVLPTARDAAASPWFGVDSTYSYSQGGEVSGMFHRFLQGTATSERIEDLRGAIDSALQDHPQWQGGKVMLALIDIKAGRGEEGRRQLQGLVSDDEHLDEIPASTCWFIGQELDQFEETREVAMELFQRALESSPSSRQLQYSPVVRLVKLYAETGRADEARDLLRKSLRVEQDMYDRQYSSYIYIQNSIWAAEQLLDLGFAVDSLRLLNDLRSDSEMLEQAGQWYGSRPEYYANMVKTLFPRALDAVGTSGAGEVAAELLKVSENRRTGAAALDLILQLPEITELNEQRMESRLLDLLKSFGAASETRLAVDQRLETLWEENPEDLSIGIVLTAFRLQTQHPRGDAALQRLVDLLEEHSLEEVAEGRRPNSRQRREAALSIPLWLVARQCLVEEGDGEAAAAIGARALEGARRQMDSQAATAILYDWGQLLLERGERAEAEQKWAELLRIATRRPQRKRDAGGGNSQPPRAAPARPRTLGAVAPQDAVRLVGNRNEEESVEGESAEGEEALAEVIAPLTISQFRVAMLVARTAAEHAMEELSREAVREGLVGGAPVPDVGGTSSDPRGGGVIMSSSGGVVSMAASGMTDGSAASLEAEMGAALRNVLAIWRREAYSPGEVYTLLQPIVLPPTRASEILMHADSGRLLDLRVSSLADELVHWARQAEKLDELRQQVAMRQESAPSAVAAIVMQTQIALAADDLDAAHAHLNDLAMRGEAAPALSLLELACHAAIAARHHPSLQEPAHAILQSTLQQRLQEAQGGNLISSRLAETVGRYLAEQEGPDLLAQHFDHLLASRQLHYARYSGDYGLNLQWSDLASLAEQAARFGSLPTTLQFLGRVADYEVGRHTRPSVALSLASVIRDLQAETLADRYRIWRDWTMPQEDRQTVRMIVEWRPTAAVPEAFRQLPPLADSENPLLCNLSELVAAADEAGMLAELKEQAHQAYQEKLPHADLLWPLVLLRSGDESSGLPLLEELAKTLPERAAAGANRPPHDVRGDLLVYLAALEAGIGQPLQPEWKDRLSKMLRDRQQAAALAHLEVATARSAARQLGIEIEPGKDPELSHWLIAPSRRESDDAPPPWWTVYEDKLVHLAGATEDLLYLAYPLAGDFTISFESYQRDYGNAEVGFNGVIPEQRPGDGQMMVSSVSLHEQVQRTAGMKRPIGYVDHGQLKVGEGKCQYFINGYLAYEEPLSGTSPWLTLLSRGTPLSAYRNFRIEGQPVIPREVSLLADDRMDGWNCSFYNESQPRKRLMAEPVDGERDRNAQMRRSEPTTFDWETKGGVLLGEAQRDAAHAEPSWIYYQRPLRSGETFRYDFHYVPGSSVAHPTIGRVALLLEPDAVKTRWIAQPSRDEILAGVSEDHELVEADYRRGPAELPLRPHEWNQVAVTLEDEVAIVALNGVVVCERPCEPELDRRFGVFRFKGQASKVRDAVLSGPWPAEFSAEMGTSLLAVAEESSASEPSVIHELLMDGVLEQDASRLVARARSLPAEQAYEELRRWVLPQSPVSGFRMYFQYAPTTAMRESDSPWDRLHCPAVELVGAAAELGRLEALAKEVQAAPAANPLEQRNQLALTALIAIESGDAAAARQHLGEIYARLQDPLPKELPPRHRAAEFVAAWQAAQQPSLQLSAHDIALRLRDMDRAGESNSGNNDWRTRVSTLASQIDAELRGVAEHATSSDGTLRQWQRVPYIKPETRFKGFLPSHWHYHRGSLQHIPAETWEQLFFQSPLRGKFEIHAYHSTFGHRELLVAYGMHNAQPRFDLNSKRITTLMHGRQDYQGRIVLPDWRQMADFRIVVDGLKVTSFANGVQIHEEVFSSPPDPWVVLQTDSAVYPSTLRNLRIVGTPEIPDEIDLVDMAGWSAWRADMYGDWFAQEAGAAAPWKRSGNEIVGQIRKRSGTMLESLLMYQRPMLEDGQIEFETFYVPGEQEVHPALGRLALLLRPDGVGLHQLTDAQYETSGLTSDNEVPLAGAANELPLKADDWNRIRLVLQGDQLSLHINDVEVGRHTVEEPPTERYFGLFRYADRMQCRVRNVVYRGEWPKSLPPVEEQQLAYPTGGPAQLADSPELTTLEIPLDRPVEELKEVGIEVRGPASRVKAGEGGLHILLSDAKGFGDWPWLNMAHEAAGDCEVTLDYENLAITPHKQGWGAAFGLLVHLDDPADSEVDVKVQTGPEGGFVTRATLRRDRAHGPRQNVEERVIGGSHASGRFRLVRRGGEVHCLVAPADSEEFHLVESYPVGKAKIVGVSIQTKASDDHAKVEATMKKLTLRF